MDNNLVKHKTENKTKNEEMIDSNEEVFDANMKTFVDDFQDMNDRVLSEEELENIGNKTNGENGCKLCPDEDLSTQFFASGPFYAIDSSVQRMAQNIDESVVMDRRERSEECNVLYAEMPEDMDQLGDNHSIDHMKTTSTMASTTHPNDSTQHLMIDRNYQFICYNCCSPLSVSEDSQMGHNLYYISSDESKVATDERTDEDHRSSPSPLMLKFCTNRDENIDNNSVKEETNSSSCSERVSKYTTVIKPKAVRPLFAPNGQSTANSFRSTLPILSFHGSANVLTDSDSESAFTQISRRRSNSEATHHYQSIASDDTNCPTSSTRPIVGHQRSKSVNKSYNSLENTLNLNKCQTISDKHLTQTEDKNPNNIYLKPFDKNLRQRTSSQTYSHSEPIHMTLEEVRNIFSKNQSKRLKNAFFAARHKRSTTESEDRNCLNKSKSKSKIKSAIESIFRHKRKSGSPVPSVDRNSCDSEIFDNKDSDDCNASNHCANDSTSPFTYRALPPLPNNNNRKIESQNTDQSSDRDAEEHQKFLDYAASIERVKDCGWYWGPISGEMAEKLLSSEPCGSFIVRDSSDEHYIFSLTFKLDGLVRHVRIEHDQGNFSFGSLQKFRSNTIVDFIENAVQHSRSGRFLFFLHRRPVMGPMRVQLLHPVSRFKQIQSLQHICRFIILKHVRRDLIEELPLPQMLKTYLNTPYYYSEELALMSEDEPKAEVDQSLPPISSHSDI